MRGRRPQNQREVRRREDWNTKGDREVAREKRLEPSPEQVPISEGREQRSGRSDVKRLRSTGRSEKTAKGEQTERV